MSLTGSQKAARFSELLLGDWRRQMDFLEMEDHTLSGRSSGSTKTGCSRAGHPLTPAGGGEGCRLANPGLQQQADCQDTLM